MFFHCTIDFLMSIRTIATRTQWQSFRPLSPTLPYSIAICNHFVSICLIAHIIISLYSNIELLFPITRKTPHHSKQQTVNRQQQTANNFSCSEANFTAIKKSLLLLCMRIACVMQYLPRQFSFLYIYIYCVS